VRLPEDLITNFFYYFPCRQLLIRNADVLLKNIESRDHGSTPRLFLSTPGLSKFTWDDWQGEDTAKCMPRWD
jgi:hypothetical protein